MSARTLFQKRALANRGSSMWRPYIMQFTEIGFAIFLTVVFVLYWFAAQRSLKVQNLLLLVASYLFYGWWDWRFLGLIALTTLTTYVAALYSRRRYGRILTAGNIVLNVGILILFKYLDFFGENLRRLFCAFGWNLDWFTIDVLLPVGISFYTFQAISYSVDAYKGKVEPCGDLVAFATFVSYFPQLVAGPIERASQLLSQIRHRREWNEGEAVRGLRMILFGVMKKVCVADMAGIYADRIFSAGVSDPLACLAGGILFSVQIYCDFSAYSEIARGSSALLGIRLMANFRFPYFSRNILEFWQRWHISLMLWFRDYVYIPLGGNRRGARKTMLNSMTVFFLSGLWHGAAWNFIVWGVYWGVAYVVAKSVLRMKRPEGSAGVKDLPSLALTWGVVFFGFFLFRCGDWAQIVSGFLNVWIYVLFFGGLWLVFRLCGSICGKGKAWKYSVIALVLCLLPAVLLRMPSVAAWWIWILKAWWLLPFVLVAAIEWKNRCMDFPMQRIPRGKWERWLLYMLCMLMVVLSEPTDMSFIYFQF